MEEAWHDPGHAVTATKLRLVEGFDSTLWSNEAMRSIDIHKSLSRPFPFPQCVDRSLAALDHDPRRISPRTRVRVALYGKQGWSNLAVLYSFSAVYSPSSAPVSACSLALRSACSCGSCDPDERASDRSIDPPSADRLNKATRRPLSLSCALVNLSRVHAPR